MRKSRSQTVPLQRSPLLPIAPHCSPLLWRRILTSTYLSGTLPSSLGRLVYLDEL